MNEEFLSKLNAKLESYRAWCEGRVFKSVRLVQSCGNDLVGAIDVLIGDVESQIEGLVSEGFYVDWAQHEHQLFLRVWEFGGPDPDWPSVIAERASRHNLTIKCSRLPGTAGSKMEV